MARATIEIDLEKCVGCKKCMAACFTDVYRYDSQEKKIIPKYIDECEVCLVCEMQCPVNCIKIVPIVPTYFPYPFD